MQVIKTKSPRREQRCLTLLLLNQNNSTPVCSGSFFRNKLSLA
jgi:hypothetical protein